MINLTGMRDNIVNLQKVYISMDFMSDVLIFSRIILRLAMFEERGKMFINLQMLFPLDLSHRTGVVSSWGRFSFFVEGCEFHETCHSVTFIVLVNSHQR